MPREHLLQELEKTKKTIFRSYPHHSGEITKRRFTSTLIPTVHTNPSQKWSFSKTLLELEEFENAGFSLSGGQEAFGKRWRDIIV